jgi:hypothetical protein
MIHSNDGVDGSMDQIPWKQIPRPPASKQRDPIQGEFFNTDTITTLAKQLTREGIGQNPMDAAVETPVRVRVFVSGSSGALPPLEAAEYFTGLRPHVESTSGSHGEQAGLQFDQPCQFLTIEDFNTSGLLGDPAATDPPEDGSANDFFYFFRAEGKSGKSGSDRGRWGVGKFVFPMASHINSFFGLTVRSGSPSEGAVDRLLIGQAVLKNHRIGNHSYEPDGWWANWVEGIPVPITHEAVLQKFCDDWCVIRNGEPGLSVVIPYVGEGLTPDHLFQAIIVDYYLAILQGKFEVVVASPSLEEDMPITASTLGTALERISDPEQRDELRRRISIAKWHMDLSGENLVQVERVTSGAPRWSQDRIAEDDRVVIKDRLAAGKTVAVRVPVMVELQEGDTPGVWSYFDVVFAPESGHNLKPQFVREGLIVTEVNSPRLSNIRCLVIIEDEKLAQMVGDAEGPAHTNWSPRTQKFVGKYRYGRDWISLIKKAPSEILRIARQEDEEEDRKALAQFFPTPVSEPAPDRPVDPMPDPGLGPTDPPPPPPPPPTPKRYRVGKVRGGFSVHLTAEGRAVSRLQVRVAYDRRGGNALKNWSKDDFDIGAPPIELELSGATVLDMRGNEFTVEIVEAADFALHLRGFDENRDLRVDVTAEDR